MPTPAQVREERIAKLFKEFNGQNIMAIDAIFNKALELFPHITEGRAKDYAKAVLRMLKTKREGGA